MHDIIDKIDKYTIFKHNYYMHCKSDLIIYMVFFIYISWYVYQFKKIVWRTVNVSDLNCSTYLS